jgi:hypothetical protein
MCCIAQALRPFRLAFACIHAATSPSELLFAHQSLRMRTLPWLSSGAFQQYPRSAPAPAEAAHFTPGLAEWLAGFE